MKSTPDIIKTLSAQIRKSIWFLGLHAFSLILFLIFIDVILGGFVFYSYVFLAERETPKATGNITKFDLKTYQDVLDELQANGQGTEEPSTPTASLTE